MRRAGVWEKNDGKLVMIDLGGFSVSEKWPGTALAFTR